MKKQIRKVGRPRLNGEEFSKVPFMSTLTKSKYEKIRQMARESHRSLSGMVSMIIENYIENQEETHEES